MKLRETHLVLVDILKKTLTENKLIITAGGIQSFAKKKKTSPTMYDLKRGCKLTQLLEKLNMEKFFHAVLCSLLNQD